MGAGEAHAVRRRHELPQPLPPLVLAAKGEEEVLDEPANGGVLPKVLCNPIFRSALKGMGVRWVPYHVLLEGVVGYFGEDVIDEPGARVLFAVLQIHQPSEGKKFGRDH